MKTSLYNQNQLLMSATLENRPPSKIVPSDKEKTISSPGNLSDRFSPNNDELTERISTQLNELNNLDLKETERHPRKTPILLTQRSSPTERVTQKWDYSQKVSTRSEDVKGIEYLLAKEGLLEVFNCFQNFRGIMIESLSGDDEPAMRTKIQFHQAVSQLKRQLASLPGHFKYIESDECHYESGSDQFQLLLFQVRQLRLENQRLRQKNRQLKQDSSQKHSLINNSLTYGNSSQGSAQIDQDTFNLDFRLGAIHNILGMGSKSTTISLENSIKKVYLESAMKSKDGQSHFGECSSFGSRVISQQSNYEVEASKSKISVVLCECEKQKWMDLISNSIKTVKAMFHHHFQACNLAFLKSNQMSKLKPILAQYSQFPTYVPNRSQSSYLSQSANLLTFTLNHSISLSQLVKAELRRLKQQEHKK